MIDQFFVGNDNLLLLGRPTNALYGSLIADGIGTVTIKDSTGTPISGVSWPLNFSWYAQSYGGSYAVIIPKTAITVNGSVYTAIIDLTSPTAGNAHWEHTFTATTRN